MSISVIGVRDMVEDVWGRSDIPVPEAFHSDWAKIIGETGDVTNFNQLRLRICRKIDTAMKDDTTRACYKDGMVKIFDEVRFLIAIELGLKERVSKPGRGGKQSVSSGLKEFLRSLPADKEWSIDDLQNWGRNSKGMKLYSRVYYMTPWSLDSIRLMLGDSAERLLKRNPFAKKIEKKIRSQSDARKYFCIFLNSLGEGEKWSYRILYEWKSDEINGSTIAYWLFQSRDEDSFGDAARRLLGDEADVILSRNPYERFWKINSIEEAKAHLIQFLETLGEGESWSISDLQSWENPDGSDGSSLYTWIMRNMVKGEREVNEDIIRALLGDDNDMLLKRNPFEHRSINIRNIEDAKRYLKEFLGGLPKSAKWGPGTLCGWDGGVKGTTLHHWIQMNIRHNNSVNWFFVLTNMVPRELLRRHPFCHSSFGVIDVKSLPGERRPSLTGRPELDDGRAVIRSPQIHQMDPEALTAITESQALLKRAIEQHLDEREKELIRKFYDEEEVSQDELNPIIAKLQIFIRA